MDALLKIVPFVERGVGLVMKLLADRSASIEEARKNFIDGMTALASDIVSFRAAFGAELSAAVDGAMARTAHLRAQPGSLDTTASPGTTIKPE